MSVSLNPLSSTLGVEATGIDLSGPVASEDLSAMQQALRERLVMVVRGQNFTPACSAT